MSCHSFSQPLFFLLVCLKHVVQFLICLDLGLPFYYLFSIFPSFILLLSFLPSFGLFEYFLIFHFNLLCFDYISLWKVFSASWDCNICTELHSLFKMNILLLQAEILSGWLQLIFFSFPQFYFGFYGYTFFGFILSGVHWIFEFRFMPNLGSFQLLWLQIFFQLCTLSFFL